MYTRRKTGQYSTVQNSTLQCSTEPAELLIPADRRSARRYYTRRLTSGTVLSYDMNALATSCTMSSNRAAASPTPASACRHSLVADSSAPSTKSERHMLYQVFMPFIVAGRCPAGLWSRYTVLPRVLRLALFVQGTLLLTSCMTVSCRTVVPMWKCRCDVFSLACHVFGLLLLLSCGAASRRSAHMVRVQTVGSAQHAKAC